MTTDRRADLAGARLRGLLRQHLATEPPEPTRLGGGAAAVVDSTAWVTFADARRGALGLAVGWAISSEATALSLVVDESATDLAHAATAIGTPATEVWQVAGASMSAVVPVAPVIEPAPRCPDLLAALSAADLEIVADHGVWIGELNGLEVARVGLRNGQCSIDVGVGAYDQFAAAAIDPDRPLDEGLRHVTAIVSRHRRVGAPPHPIGRLVRSRWLRAQAVRDPALLGLDRLDPVPLTTPRPGLNETQTAAAIGGRGDERVLVVFGVGVDLGVADDAAALTALHEPDEALFVLPARDVHPRLEAFVGALGRPSRLVALDGEWAD